MIHMKCISKLYCTENPSSAEVKQCRSSDYPDSELEIIKRDIINVF